MATPKVMKVISKETAAMECRVCGARHSPKIMPGGKFARGSWQCANDCKLPETKSAA